jgi:hypothetical protein
MMYNDFPSSSLIKKVCDFLREIPLVDHRIQVELLGCLENTFEKGSEFPETKELLVIEVMPALNDLLTNLYPVRYTLTTRYVFTLLVALSVNMCCFSMVLKNYCILLFPNLFTI